MAGARAVARAAAARAGRGGEGRGRGGRGASRQRDDEPFFSFSFLFFSFLECQRCFFPLELEERCLHFGRAAAREQRQPRRSGNPLLFLFLVVAVASPHATAAASKGSTASKGQQRARSPERPRPARLVPPPALGGRGVRARGLEAKTAETVLLIHASAVEEGGGELEEKTTRRLMLRSRKRSRWSSSGV